VSRHQRSGHRHREPDRRAAARGGRDPPPCLQDRRRGRWWLGLLVLELADEALWAARPSRVISAP